jgi:hypothetical protein
MVGTRRAATLVAAVVCSSTALLLLLPTSAVADDSLVDDVDTALDETVDDATEVVADSVDDVTEVVGESVDDVTSVVADSVSDANGAATTTGGHIGDATNDAVGPINEGTEQSGTPGSGGQGRESGGGAEPAADEHREREITRATGDGERQGQRGATDEWVWSPSDRLELLEGNVPVGPATIVATEGNDDDPCHDDASLVCLGLLYGIGRYAKAFSNVLGVVATTGVGIAGLAVLALALGTMGSAALAASRTRSGGAVARL